MVKEIRWSLRADRDRQRIEKYWTNRNKSNSYSLKLDKLFRESVKLLPETPELGISTELDFVRFIIVGHYLIYYRVTTIILK